MPCKLRFSHKGLDAQSSTLRQRRRKRLLLMKEEDILIQKTRHQVQSIPIVKDKGKGLPHRDSEPSTLKSPVKVCLNHLVVKSISLSFVMYGRSFIDSTTDTHDSIFIVHYFSLTQWLTFMIYTTALLLQILNQASEIRGVNSP